MISRLKLGTLALTLVASSAVVYAVTDCYVTITGKCTDVLGDGGPTPYLDRVCGTTPCPDVIVIDPVVSVPVSAPDGTPGLTGITSLPTCEATWYRGFCVGPNFNICAYPYPRWWQSNTGYPGAAAGQSCTG